MTAAPATTPAGVTLQDWDDFDAQRASIYDKVLTAVTKKFPQSYGGVRLEVHDLAYEDPENRTLAEQKKALMQNQFLHRRLRGTYRLVDEKTGETLEERRSTLMKVPLLTERGTFIHNGNEYTTLRQARLLPGVFTRRKATGELESHFNARRGTGSSFRVRLEPESGLWKLDVGQASLRLYSLLRDLGVPDAELEKRWGPELLAANRDKYDGRVFDKAYARLVRRPDPEATREAKAEAIKNALASTKLDRRVMERTLPNLFNQKLAAAWRSAATTRTNEKTTVDCFDVLAPLFGDPGQHAHSAGVGPGGGAGG